jgi:hypothetical protein
MTRRELIATALVAVTMGLPLAATAQAQPFIDDFEDGSATDGEPVTWAPLIDPWNQGGTVEVVNGELLLTPSPTAPPPAIPDWWTDYVENYVLAGDRRFMDVSVHTRARVSGAGNGWVYVEARDTWNDDPNALGTSVYAAVGIDLQGNQLVGLGGSTGSGFMTERRRTTSLNIHENDVHLQLDAVGDTASLFAWEHGEDKPETPLLTRTLEPSQMVAGLIGLCYGQARPSVHPTNQLNTASFRFVEVVPEPLLGDVNLDSQVNGLDVDPFVDVLLNGPYQPEADMNEDEVVNGLDVDPFVAAVVGGTQPIPEPSTLLLALCSLGVVGGWRKWGG